MRQAGKRPRLPPRWFVRLFWDAHRRVYRLSRGRVGLWRPKGNRWGTLTLRTTGRRTGKERAVIVGYFEDGPNLVTMAMNGWADPEPAWWLNLQAHPEATVEQIVAAEGFDAEDKEGAAERLAKVPLKAVYASPITRTLETAEPIANAMVVGPDNTVQQRQVVVSQTIGDKWLVESGLTAGDKVIVEGLQKVRPGAAVRISEANGSIRSLRSSVPISGHPTWCWVTLRRKLLPVKSALGLPSLDYELTADAELIVATGRGREPVAPGPCSTVCCPSEPQAP